MNLKRSLVNSKGQETREDSGGNSKGTIICMKTLNTIENAILEYWRKHADFISNPYKHFARELGYKKENYIYTWFAKRSMGKIGLADLKKLIEITGDEKIVDAVIEELNDSLKKGLSKNATN